MAIPMKKPFFAVMVTALAGVAMAVDPVPVYWIGGASGSPMVAANWDPAHFPGTGATAYYQPVITNSVNFTDTSDKTWFYLSRFTVKDNSTVSFTTHRFWPSADSVNNTEYPNEVVDVETGSTLALSWLAGGNPSINFVKTGGGSFSAAAIGSGGNNFNKATIKEGVASVSSYIMLRDDLTVDAGATLKVTQAKVLGYSSEVWPWCNVINGELLCNGNQRVNGIAGTGVIAITNNSAHVLTLDLVSQGTREFSGRFYGKLKVAPSNVVTSASCLVIGDALSLFDCELTVEPGENCPRPIQFKPGIGTFYVKDRPEGKFYDTNGEEIELVDTVDRFVDCEVAASGDGLTWGTAYRTLADAMGDAYVVAGRKVRVRVAKGVYDQGEMANASRVTVPGNVFLVSEEGAEKTVIMGQSATSDDANDGCGSSGALRCIYANAGARIKGFTITGGRTTLSTQGGGLWGSSSSFYVIDCIITNNVSKRGGGGSSGNYIRCYFKNNRATELLGSALYTQCNAYDCVFDTHTGNLGYYVGGDRAIVRNCVFGPDFPPFRTDGVDAKVSSLYNSIFMCGISSSAAKESMYATNCVFLGASNSSRLVPGAGCVVTNIANNAAKLAWLGLGSDLRPIAPGIGYAVNHGANEHHLLPANAREDDSIDIDGNPRISGGAIDLGPFEWDCSRTFYSLTFDDGGIDVTGAEPGLAEVEEGHPVTITLRRNFNGAKLCSGFTVNGTFYDFEDYPDGWSTTVTKGDGTVDIRAVYTDRNDYWVDEKKGSDSNSGFHRDCPKATLAGAMAANPASGATVWVEPGWYTNLTMSSANDGVTSDYRAEVPAGVTLRSTGGAAETFIMGQPSPNPPASNCKGCGPGAIAGIKLGSGAKLVGFTVTNCYQNCTSNSSGGLGGGVRGGSAEDCVFVDCQGIRGGGAQGTKCVRCRFIKCSTPYIGVAANECAGIYNCYFTDCDVGSYLLLNCKDVVNCTFGTGNTTIVYDISNRTTVPKTESNVRNCAIVGQVNEGGDFSYCIFAKNGNVSEVSKGAGSVILDVNYANMIAALGMDTEGRPTAGSMLIDSDVASNAEYDSSRMGDTDFAGGQRIYNGRIDIGAFEYDWRGEYAARVSRRFECAAASPTVTNGVATVDIPDGGSVKLALRAGQKLGTFKLDVAVSDGTLTVRKNGETVSELTADAVIDLEFTVAADEFEFAYSGSGSARLGHAASTNGMILFIR